MKIISSLILCLLSLTALAEKQKPNFIIILTDDAGNADFGFQGSKDFPTPHIDSIAQNGVKFTDGYVSGAVCSPSRAGLMTGRYQGRFGYENNLPPGHKTGGLDSREVTFADSMKKLGYATGVIGKWHLGYMDKHHPNKRGFDHFYGCLQGMRSFWPYKKAHPHRVIQLNGKPTPETDEYMTDRLGKGAIEFIKNNKSKPFFLYLSFTAVHTPIQASDKDLAAFKNSKLSKARKKLGAMTKSMDDNVGRVIETLKKNNIYDNTIIVFLSDNGGTNSGINKPFRAKKGHLYEGGIRVPFCLQWPAKIKAKQVITEPVISLDLLPTAVAAAGSQVPAEQKVDGINLIPFLNGEKAIPARTLFWRKHTGAPTAQKSLRKGKWKYVFANGKHELYDLTKDLGESKNLKDQYPEVLASLQKEMRTWESGMKAPLFGKGSTTKKRKKGNKK